MLLTTSDCVYLEHTPIDVMPSAGGQWESTLFSHKMLREQPHLEEGKGEKSRFGGGKV